ncbi:MAG: VanZ family protein [Betaproteobacteria bacterium]|nr:VanZ family protein [Betaproteobacteria bacterium]
MQLSDATGMTDRMAGTDGLSVRIALAWRGWWLAAGWALILFVIYLSLTPEPVQLGVEEGDKYGHAIAYATLMSWFANLYESRSQRPQWAAGFVAMGVAIEFAQRWTCYRSFEIADMAAGTAGVAIGWAIASSPLPNYLRVIERLLRRA